MNEKQKLAFRIYNDLFLLSSITENEVFGEFALRIADLTNLWDVIGEEGKS